MPLPQRKTRTSRDSNQTVRTCCCRESMGTSCITMTGRTWTGESRTALYVSVVGASLLISQQAGTPRPPERWVAASWQSWPRNGRGSRQELELQDTPCICPLRSHKDVAHSQGPRDLGPANVTDGHLGEGSPRGPGLGRRGGRGRLRGQGYLRRRGGGSGGEKEE